MANKKTSKKSKDQFYDLKLAGIIIGFAFLTYASPSIWNRYDNFPVIAAGETEGGVSPEERPKPEYVVKAFFYQIDAGSSENAFNLMAPETIKYTKKIWKEDFSNIYFVKLRSLELNKEDEDTKTYLVRLDVRLKGSRLKTLWQNGENKRLVTLKLVDNQWKISEIIKPQN